ncbi:hypothetical protein BRADI_2g34832v3 [Brachypodium distachyon]|uniref:Uncharacterized protein n=1 Tax=Brachypodium distachyon TaxID=15368 RepID=A0A0Q3GA54_BRADI|nr:hypothetical protein BRADI_2g34832v3 [Brachypodium distachyon]
MLLVSDLALSAAGGLLLRVKARGTCRSALRTLQLKVVISDAKTSHSHIGIVAIFFSNCWRCSRNLGSGNSYLLAWLTFRSLTQIPLPLCCGILL